VAGVCDGEGAEYRICICLSLSVCLFLFLYLYLYCILLSNLSVLCVSISLKVRIGRRAIKRGPHQHGGRRGAAQHRHVDVHAGAADGRGAAQAWLVREQPRALCARLARELARRGDDESEHASASSLACVRRPRSHDQARLARR
jgi:hypothetical protein